MVLDSGITASDQAIAQSVARDMDRLESMTKRLRVDYQRFVVGDLLMPPTELQAAALGLVRSLRERAKSVSERYRLQSIESKLNSHIERYGREVRKREQSHEAQLARRAEPKADPRFDPATGVVVGRQASRAAEQALYDALYPQKTGAAPAVDLDRFRAHLRRNVELIQAKTGCQEVSFRIAVEDGKTKLKAKPIRAAG